MKATLIKHGSDALTALNHLAYLFAAGVTVGYGAGVGLMLAAKFLL